MCGICGIVATDPGLIETGTRAMMRAMQHRGPDDEGFELLPIGEGESGPFVGLGFRRLSILDLSSAGHQPMFNPNTGDCLVYNGELYNFRGLRAELQTNGILFQSSGDTEVVLKALSMWGEPALQRFNGMFSLAFYHAASRRILLARDPLGIKPLYVASLANRFLFASEIRTLLTSSLVPTDPDLAGVTGMLAYGAVQAPRTAFAAIRSFPAGCSQWLDAGSAAGRRPAPPRRYWQFAGRQQEIVDTETVAAEVRQRLHDAVLRHAVADVPVGVFLSAGVDSSIVMAFAREHVPQIKGFTVGFGSVHGEDEVPIAAATAKALGVEHVAVELDASNMPEKWHDWLAAMDSPSIDGFNSYVVSRRLAQEGVTVGLSGLGADELFGGYSHFSKTPLLARLLQGLAFIPRSLRGNAIRTLGLCSGKRDAVEKLADAFMGDPSVAGVTKAARRLLSNTTLGGLGLGARQAGLAPDYMELNDDREDPALDGDPFNTVSRLEMTHYMRDMLLRDTDANSMRHSLEVRVPFLDLPLVEYVSSLPGRPVGRCSATRSRTAARPASRCRSATGCEPRCETPVRPPSTVSRRCLFWMGPPSAAYGTASWRTRHRRIGRGPCRSWCWAPSLGNLWAPRGPTGMCGIAGVVCANPAAVEPAVRAMMRAMVHRGPDDEGFLTVALAGRSAETTATCGLGFRRLAIMDLSPLGHQPMVDPATGDAIVFNGEIYNAPDLRRRLEAQGTTFRSTGDTEVLLRALSVWGERALDELDGMFAFAFHHAASRRLLLARDPLGIKPLYVARVRGAVVFASEVRAVLASGLVPDDLDAAGIAGMLAYGAPQDPLTVHVHVRSMPAGTCTWLDGSALAGASERLRRYWRFPERLAEPSEAAAEQRVRRDLTESVRRQCVADVPLGVFLSGGIDSATMAALAMETQGHVDTFAVGYEVAGVTDETAAAAETAHFLGTRHYQTIVDDDWAIMQWCEWLKVVDRPSIDGLNTYIVSGAVKDRDITVALSGLGGDELFGGYSSFWRVPRARAALAGLAWLPANVRRAVAGRIFGRLPAEKRAKAVDLLSSRGSAIALTALSRRVLSDEALVGLGFDANRLGLTPEFLPPEAFDAFPTMRTGTFERVGQAELSLYMGNTLLRDTDVNSMAHSLEIRVPFLGRDLVDYVAGLPGRTRAPRRSQPKHLLRRAMAERLPPSVFSRPKAGFSLPFGEWMRGPLREQCQAAIDTLAGWGGIDTPRVRQAWDDHVAQRRAMHGSRTMALVVLGNYLAQAKDRRSTGRAAAGV